MLTALCFLFVRRNNLRSSLSPLAILYVKKVNISREQKLIKYFKQRNSDISGWSGPLLLFCVSVVYPHPQSVTSSSAHLSIVLLLLHKDRKSVNADRRDSPGALWPMAFIYTCFCWPSGNLRLRSRLRRRLMGFSVEDGLRSRLMDFKVWQRISVASELPRRLIHHEGTISRLEPTKGFNKQHFKKAISDHHLL